MTLLFIPAVHSKLVIHNDYDRALQIASCQRPVNWSRTHPKASDRSLVRSPETPGPAEGQSARGRGGPRPGCYLVVKSLSLSLSLSDLPASVFYGFPWPVCRLSTSAIQFAAYHQPNLYCSVQFHYFCL